MQQKESFVDRTAIEAERRKEEMKQFEEDGRWKRKEEEKMLFLSSEIYKLKNVNRLIFFF